MREDAIQVAFATDANFIHHTTVALHSLLSNTSRRVEATILYDGVSAEARETLLQSCAVFQAPIRFVQVDVSRVAALPPLEHRGSRASYFRLLLPEMMPESVNKVLYLDSDTVCRGDIGPLWDTDLAGHAIAAVREPYWPRYVAGSLWSAAFPSARDRERFVLADTFNAGVLLFDLQKWRAHGLTDAVIAWRIQNDHLTRLCDQGALNAVIGQDWLQLSARWNFGPWFLRRTRFSARQHRRRLDPVVIHFSWSHGPHPYSHLYRQFLTQTAWGEAGRRSLRDADAWRPRLKTAARRLHSLLFPFLYGPATEYGLPPGSKAPAREAAYVGLPEATKRIVRGSEKPGQGANAR